MILTMPPPPKKTFPVEKSKPWHPALLNLVLIFGIEFTPHKSGASTSQNIIFVHWKQNFHTAPACLLKFQDWIKVKKILLLIKKYYMAQFLFLALYCID